MALECYPDLLDDPIVRVIEATPALLVERADPGGADQRQQDVAAANRLPDDVGEVQARRDVVNVHEHIAELLGEAITKTPRCMSGVFTPIAHKDSRGPFALRGAHHQPSP